MSKPPKDSGSSRKAVEGGNAGRGPGKGRYQNAGTTPGGAGRDRPGKVTPPSRPPDPPGDPGK